jgi:hypothetical protein
MMKVSAFCNDTVAMICWDPGATKVDNCLGFKLTRVDESDKSRLELSSYALFEGQTSTEWKPIPTSLSPIQKLNWMDFNGQDGKTYHYEVVAMIGIPGQLKPSTTVVGVSNSITLTTKIDDTFQAAFTRGILSTQALALKLGADADGVPDFKVLLKAIQTPGDPIRESLLRNVMKVDQRPIEMAREIGGRVLQMFYEVNDPEMIKWLMDNKDIWSLILGNTGPDDETNKAFRAQAHAAKCDVTDRMLVSSEIAHNKVQAVVDKKRKGVMVNAGSTNKTYTGYCCQSNNVVNIASPELADLYVEEYDLLKADNSQQGPALRAANATRRKDVVLKDGTKITVWFSPNTKLRMKPKANAPVPPDMQEVFDCIDKARQAFFLAFYPGAPSIITYLADLLKAKPDVMVRGAVSSADAMPRTQLFHRAGELPAIVSASGIEKQFANYMKELLKLPDSHAIIHDKIMVLNPFSDDCVVIIASHNLGFKASYQNDENLLIIRGHKKLAQAYLVHILDVYNHYRFRSAVNAGKSKFNGFLVTTDAWQDKYQSGNNRKEVMLFAGTLTDTPPAASATVAVPTKAVGQTTAVPVGK